MKVEAEGFKVLSVETRIKIIELLKQGPLSVSEIAESLGVSQPAASQHLRVLKQAGLVSDERKGYYIIYQINKEKLEEYQKGLKKICTCGCSPLTRVVEHDKKENLLKYKEYLEKEMANVEKLIKDVSEE
jgi:DNA-binding transcriptional ArsR family regulator